MSHQTHIDELEEEGNIMKRNVNERQRRELSFPPHIQRSFSQSAGRILVSGHIRHDTFVGWGFGRGHCGNQGGEDRSEIVIRTHYKSAATMQRFIVSEG